MKAIAISFLALLLFGGSACTKVDVSVRVPTESRTLTGTNCKLKMELRNQKQKTDFWCWAAAAHTVIEYLKQEPIRQCDVVNAVFRDDLMRPVSTKDPVPLADADPSDPVPLADADPSPHCCMAEAKFINPDDPWYVQRAADVCWRGGLAEMVFKTQDFRTYYEKYEYDGANEGPQGLSWDEIVSEICEDRPIISSIVYSNDRGGGGHAVVIGGYKELGDGSQWVQVYDPGYSTLEGDFYVWPYDVYLGDPGVFTHVRDYKNISVQH